MNQFKYMKLKLSNFPEDCVDWYQLGPKSDKSGQVYVETKKGKYEVPQVGLLAQELLEERLNKRGHN